MDTKLRPSGIEGLGDMPWGTHFCLFYETKEDLLNILIPYFRTGLENHESCLWVTPEPLSLEEAKRTIREAGPEFERHLEEGQIEIVSYADWYIAGGRFNIQRVLQDWIDKHDQAIAKGYAGLRCTGNTFWLEKHQWDSFAKYEVEIDEIVSKLQIIVLCTYPLQSRSARDVLDVVHQHQFTVAKRNGVWEHLQGSELKRAHDEIRQLNADLERRVVERTAQLAATNEQLKLEIIERKQAEEGIRKSEQVLREAESLGHTGSWEQNLVTGEIFNTDENLRLFFGDDRSKGTDFEDYAEAVHPDDREYVMQRRAQLLTERGPSDIEYRVVWPDGNVHVIFGRATVVYDELGQAIRVYGTNVDITERKQAEEHIRFQANVLSQVLDVVIAIDNEYRITYWNAAAERLYGFKSDEVLGQQLEQVNHYRWVKPEDEKAANDSLSATGSWRGKNIHLKKSGEEIYVESSVSVLKDQSGNTIGLLAIIRDITERKRAEEELRTQKEILQKIFDHTPMMIGMIGTDGKWLMVNQAWERTMGWTFEELHQPNLDILAEVYPDPQEHQRVLDFIAAPAGEWADFKARVRDGRVLDVTFTNVRLSDGKTLGFGLDITERKQAEEEIKWQASRAETLARIASSLNNQLDLDAVIHAICEEAINIFKVSQATMSLYDKKRDLLVYAGGVNVPPEYVATMEPITRSQFDDFLGAMGPIIVIPDIQSFPDVPNARFSSDLDVRTVVTTAMLRNQELIGVLVVGVNGHVREFAKDELTLLKAVSDQAAQAIANAQLLKAANEQHEQLRALSAKLVEAQESERKRLAREIHDDISQTLTASIMQLGTAKSLLPKSAKSAYTILEQTEELIKNTLEQTRLIIADLRPPVLDDLGLAPALRRLGDELQESTGATVKIKTSRLPRRLPAPIEVALFRIVQEALANIRRHAQAHHVTISLAKESERLTLSVQDDGIGFEKQTSRSRQRGDMVIEEGLVIPAGHFGLIGIQERVTQLGGKLKVTSAPGQGATLRVELPL